VPTTATPIATPNPLVVGDEINCSVICTDPDINPDTLKANFTWFVNSAPVNAYDVQVSCTNNTICHTSKNVSNALTVAEVWRCSAICYDSVAYSAAWLNSSADTVGGNVAVINLTQNMTNSSFNNVTNVSGCLVNLTITVANASQNYVHTCSAAGTTDTNTTYDFCEIGCQTTGMAACTYHQNLSTNESIYNVTYPCDLNITDNSTGGAGGVCSYNRTINMNETITNTTSPCNITFKGNSSINQTFVAAEVKRIEQHFGVTNNWWDTFINFLNNNQAVCAGVSLLGLALLLGGVLVIRR
jgi:hypothetical protein